MIFIDIKNVEMSYLIQLQNKNHEGNKKPLFFWNRG